MSTPTTLEIGQRLVTLFSVGDFETIYKELYSPDIESIEADPTTPPSKGMEGIQQKNAWFEATFQIHGMTAEGPFPHGDEFAVIFDIDTTEKATGIPKKTREIGVYNLAGGKIVRERFFYV